MSEEVLPAKFLVIRLSSIGDIVLTTPVVRCLKNQVPGAEIHYLTKKQFASLVNHNPYIDKVHVYDDDLSSLIRQLREESFDYVLDLHHNLRSQIIKSRLGILAFSFDKINFKKWLKVNLRIDKLPNVHIVDRYLDTLRLFDVENDGKGLDYFVPSTDEVNTSILPAGFSAGYIALVTGARHQTKQMPVEMMIQLCKLLEVPVVLMGGREDNNRADEIVKQCNNTYNACGAFNLNQSASLIRQSLLVITPDTGLMHIASALKKPVLSVWGNTIPAFGMYPYEPGKGSAIYEVEGLSCRPCSKLGYKTCPKGHFKCMKGIQVSDLASRANQLVREIRIGS
ncbi:MAG: glycosyltransferase family 9 protein [Bacteroidales bacterium]